MPTAEILSQGDEVVTGQIADTNAAWLSEHLTSMGFTVQQHTTVGDRVPDLVSAMQAIAGRCDICVGTGGLGPTDDDLTTRSAAAAFDQPLAFDPEAMEQIRARFLAFDRPMAPVNERQAYLPRGCTRFDNLWGTAPGFGVTSQGTHFAFLPGVPSEMRPMFRDRVVPWLHHHLPVTTPRRVTLRCIGAGESTLQQALEGWSPEPGVLSFRTRVPENQIKLFFQAGAADSTIRQVVKSALDRIGRWVYTIDRLPGEPLRGFDASGADHAQVVGALVAHHQHTLAVAESCTGGQLAAACTAARGASAWFHQGWVSYTNTAKSRELGVPAELLSTHGAVSEPVARAMAEGALARSGAHWALAVTGIAGPDGGTPEKPVGTVHVALAGAATAGGVGPIRHQSLRLGGSRKRIQSLSVAAALELLRKQLMSQEDPHGR